MDPFLGQLMCVGFNYAPQNWMPCNGQLLPISQFSALFSLLGTMYGGDGVTTFGVPDLRGRVPVGFGQGPGLGNYVQGQVGGSETVTLNAQQIPAHIHPVSCSNGEGAGSQPANSVPSSGGSYAAAPDSKMSPAMIPPSGGGNQPHENRQPYQVLNWIICYSGSYPQRS